MPPPSAAQAMAAAARRGRGLWRSPWQARSVCEGLREIRRRPARPEAAPRPGRPRREVSGPWAEGPRCPPSGCWVKERALRGRDPEN